MDMIKKLRWRLIAISMLSLAIVLLVILGAANFSNYHQITENADDVLELLLENDGVFPEFRKGGKNEVLPGGMTEDDFDEDEPEDLDEGQTALDILNRRRGRDFSEELPYSSRYFTVWADASGKITKVNTDRIFAVDYEKAVEYTENVLKSGKELGFYEN